MRKREKPAAGLRLAALLRVSTLAQTEDRFSLPQQESAIREYCARHGHELVEVLTDEGITGRRRDRPALDRMRALLASGEIQGVVLIRVDRLGRYAAVMHSVLAEIRQAGGRVLYVDIDLPDNPFGRLLENSMIGHAQLEAELFRERSMEGKTEKASSGRYPAGLRIYGYRQILRWQEHADPALAGRSGELLEHPAEAEIVRELFQQFAGGLGVNQLTDLLNERGTPAPRGGAWSNMAVRRLLGNRAYLGELVYGREEWVLLDRQGQKGGRAFRVTEREPSEWQHLPCPALIDPALFERAQVKLQQAAERLAGYPSRTYLLRGCLECAYCVGKEGRPRLYHGLRGNTNPTRPGYRIHKYRCQQCFREVKGKPLEDRAVEVLRAAVQPEAADAAAERVIATETQAATQSTDSIQRLRAGLKALDDQEERLADLVVSGLEFSAAAIRKQNEKLRKERERLTQQLRACEVSEARPPALIRERIKERAAAVLAEIDLAVAEADAGDPSRLQGLFRAYVRGRCYEKSRVMMRADLGV